VKSWCCAVWRLKSQQTTRIEIRFRTESMNGVLLTQSKGLNVRDDYLMMAVVDGRLEVSYNLGKQTSDNIFVLESSMIVSDGLWHIASLNRLVQYHHYYPCRLCTTGCGSKFAFPWSRRMWVNTAWQFGLVDLYNLLNCEQNLAQNIHEFLRNSRLGYSLPDFAFGVEGYTLCILNRTQNTEV